jgi:N-acetylmuramoyl-L-alanine amidase
MWGKPEHAGRELRQLGAIAAPSFHPLPSRHAGLYRCKPVHDAVAHDCRVRTARASDSYVVTVPPIQRTTLTATRPMSSAAVSAPGPSPSDATNVAGRLVVLDPGHNGANDSSINRQVSNGRGGTKECQTTGTSTDEGYPEHTFNWDVVLKIQEALGALGVQTALSRNNDDALGPCVDERAAFANSLAPDAIVSIHADGGPRTGRGFHVNFSSPALNDAQAGPAMELARTMRDELAASGIDESTYVGSDGLYGRADLAGLNLAQYPAILIELGNMRNGDDAAQMESDGGRSNYASAVVRGIAAYLAHSIPVHR